MVLKLFYWLLNALKFFDEDKHIMSIGVDENREFTEAVDFGVYRWFAVIFHVCRTFVSKIENHKLLM